MVVVVDWSGIKFYTISGLSKQFLAVEQVQDENGVDAQSISMFFLCVFNRSEAKNAVSLG